MGSAIRFKLLFIEFPVKVNCCNSSIENWDAWKKPAVFGGVKLYNFGIFDVFKLIFKHLGD
jgi:hypothetical protein